MKTIEYRTVDKTAWGRSPWTDEPDKRQWLDAASGLPCLAVRNSGGGNWCGYVGVPREHPWHGIGYSECIQTPKCGEDYCGHGPNVEVHGGLTFADRCTEMDEVAWLKMRERRTSWEKEAKTHPQGDAARRLADWGAVLDDHAAWTERGQARSICHLPEPGEPNDVWWFGFDCAHSGDVSPGYDRELRGFGTGHDTYRDLDYVVRQCEQLAAQLKVVPHGG